MTREIVNLASSVVTINSNDFQFNCTWRLFLIALITCYRTAMIACMSTPHKAFINESFQEELSLVIFFFLFFQLRFTFEVSFNERVVACWQITGLLLCQMPLLLSSSKQSITIIFGNCWVNFFQSERIYDACFSSDTNAYLFVREAKQNKSRRWYGNKSLICCKQPLTSIWGESAITL